ncbi:uncharacterized protein LOC113767660 [Coffea eugenioides]|uniref:uncharacterized protein LOC113767660 n=1 Tax=Coffea eugenioides TaxID=49369 RepID=UPI000F607A35|nr:uncharacterized protein LOC113767660 [Coffea eugenioides]
MASSITLIAVFSIALFACITEARKNPTDFLQSAVINEHTEDNHHAESSLSNQKKTSNGNILKDFESNFESKPGIFLWSYQGNDNHHAESSLSNQKKTSNGNILKDFESKFESMPGIFLWGYQGNDNHHAESSLSNQKTSNGNILKDFESKFESKPGIFLWGYQGNDAESKSKEEKPLVKDN